VGHENKTSSGISSHVLQDLFKLPSGKSLQIPVCKGRQKNVGNVRLFKSAQSNLLMWILLGFAGNVNCER
jgi:hypothetical protein